MAPILHALDPAQLYRVLAESAPDAILTIDEHSTVLSVNAAAERIFGYESAEIVGQPLSILIPERLRGSHHAGMTRYLATGTRRIPWQGVRVPVLTKAGVEIPVEVAFGEFTAAGRRVFSGFIRDVSDRVAAERAVEAARAEAEQRVHEAERLAEQLQEQAAELEQQTAAARDLADALERANARLREAAASAEAARLAAEAANQAKGDFLAVMSHELRTPLNAIGGYAELLEMELRGPVTPEQRGDLERIRQSQQRLLSLVNDVLSFARIDAGQVHYDIADVSTAEALADVEALLLPQRRFKGVAADVRRPVPDVLVRADRVRFEQILLNLLSNAVKFTPAGGRVTVECEERGATAFIRVRDTGRGIPADKLDAVFEPFVMVDGGRTRTAEGTGLGLAISRDLARGMGGDLIAESVEGVGSTFTLTLPRA